MAEEKSMADRLMDRIQKQAIINGIKTVFKKFPQARVILPFLKDALTTVTEQTDTYLGDADHIIIIGRKQGVSNLVILNGKKKFTLTTGLQLTTDKTDSAIVAIEPFNKYLKEIHESGIFDLITDEDTQKFKEMKDGGFDGLKGMFQEEGKKELPSGEAATSENAVTEEITETEIGQEETIQAPESINPQ